MAVHGTQRRYRPLKKLDKITSKVLTEEEYDRHEKCSDRDLIRSPKQCTGTVVRVIQEHEVSLITGVDDTLKLIILML